MYKPGEDSRPSKIATSQSVQEWREDITRQGELRAGDKINALARHYVDQWNATALVTALRERRLPIGDYRDLITRVYPVVVSFNGGLIHSIGKIDELQRSVRARTLVEEMLLIDHVRNSQCIQELAIELRMIAREEKLPVLRALAAQLREEQEHNDYYRKMLEVHSIDHEAFYTAFETYLNEIPMEERDRMTQEVLSALAEGHTPQAFPNTFFSQATLALCHYLIRTAIDPQVKFLVYFALQSAIEFALVKGVTESVFPGVAGTLDHPELNLALVPDADVAENGALPPTIKWWDEHTEYGQGGRAELQHVQHGLEQLNHNLVEKADVQDALRRVDEVLRLFAAI